MFQLDTDTFKKAFANELSAARLPQIIPNDPWEELYLAAKDVLNEQAMELAGGEATDEVQALQRIVDAIGFAANHLASVNL